MNPKAVSSPQSVVSSLPTASLGARLWQLAWYVFGWVVVRPVRWVFARMVWSTDLRLLPTHHEYLGWSFPNLHWWVLYKTVFRFFAWLHWDAWRPLCRWENGWLKHKPWHARFVHWLGSTTAGFAIGGGRCYHCGSEEGCQVELAMDETGKNFILGDTWTVGTENGTDHRFCGTTICPKCGYRDEYEDGSL